MVVLVFVDIGKGQIVQGRISLFLNPVELKSLAGKIDVVFQVGVSSSSSLGSTLNF